MVINHLVINIGIKLKENKGIDIYHLFTNLIRK